MAGLLNCSVFVEHTWIRSRGADRPFSLRLSSCSRQRFYGSTVQIIIFQRTMRNRTVSFSGENRRLRLGPDPGNGGHRQTSETSQRRMRQLRHQDIKQQSPHQNQHIQANYHLLRNIHKLGSQINHINGNNMPIPAINIIQAGPNNHVMTNTPISQTMRTNTPILTHTMRTNMTNSPMSPLSLSLGSPVYSLPSSPSSYNSPAMSPAQRERVMSPYSTPQLLSPVGKFHQVYSPGSRVVSPVGVIQGCDPYLTTKMQPSPGYQMQSSDMILDSNVPLNSSDFWNDTDILQGTSDLLTAFDDVKLV